MAGDQAPTTPAASSASGSTNNLAKIVGLVSFVAITAIYVMQTRSIAVTTYNEEISTMTEAKDPDAKGKQLKAVTWNIAAINNNPFEYWITNKDPVYNKIMANVSTFIESPGVFDVPVSEVFTDKMYTELEESMKEAGWSGLEETRKRWESEYKDRKVISEFIKDGMLGKKRLASMPDRVTNTIITTDGVAMRPSVINCYDGGDLGTLDKWWKQWREFMFTKEVTMNKQGEEKTVKIRDMLTAIKKSKYPSITEDEEKISIPLQAMCAAIFDAILVNMMNTIDKKNWQPLREDMCNKLNKRKNERTMQILEVSYASADIQFLQEVAGSFAESAKKKPLSSIFDIYYPSEMDPDRDQNSFILLKKGKFTDVVEVTASVLKELDNTKDVPLAKGDLLALTAVDAEDGTKYLLLSFHGDTNGLATIPIVTAAHSYGATKVPDHKMLFGMDANTYAKPDEDQQGVVQFAQFYRSKSLNTCYGPYPNPLNFTTFHARTHLQPQLNKAVRLEEKDIKGDKNPKDFILFFSSDYKVVSTTKDNTGERKYVDNMVFPTLAFPSDHGVTSTVLIERNGTHLRPTIKAPTASSVKAPTTTMTTASTSGDKKTSEKTTESKTADKGSDKSADKASDKGTDKSSSKTTDAKVADAKTTKDVDDEKDVKKDSKKDSKKEDVKASDDDKDAEAKKKTTKDTKTGSKDRKHRKRSLRR